MIDLAKRKRVMQRSMRLGHCICDPKKACPCDLFRERAVCLCAGETLPQEETVGPVRLTQLVEKAGCASKIDQASLKRVLAGLPAIEDPRVLVGSAAGDDAGVFRLDGSTCLVQTVDVFTPSVDDAYTFGRIAAANSLSDVYAMGGRPLVALSIVGFPIREVADEAMADILRGGIDAMSEAGVPVVGGHSIKDHQIKAGFAVTGLVDADGVVTNAGARPGDALVLTKPLGVGVLSFAVQIGRAPAGAAEAIAESMAALNKTASEAMLAHGVHACTDVTGFGLMGHLAEMARASGAQVEIVWDDLPLFPGLLECLAEGIVPGGIERNRESSEASAVPGEDVTAAMMDVCFDPQTSGGLLIALPDDAAQALVETLHGEGVADAAVIGRVVGPGEGKVHVRTTGRRQMPAAGKEGIMTTPEKESARADETESCCSEPEAADEACCGGLAAQKEPCCASHASEQPAADEPCCDEPAEEPCCAEGHASAGGAAQTAAPAGTEAMFKAFMKSAGSPGALDAATKQAVNIALSVLARCGPCIRTHVAKARRMGFSEEEIEEAAWMAVAFGGSPVMMFYKETMKSG